MSRRAHALGFVAIAWLGCVHSARSAPAPANPLQPTLDRLTAQYRAELRRRHPKALDALPASVRDATDATVEVLAVQAEAAGSGDGPAVVLLHATLTEWNAGERCPPGGVELREPDVRPAGFSLAATLIFEERCELDGPRARCTDRGYQRIPERPCPKYQ